MSDCLSVVFYARLHLLADPNKTLQGHPGGPSDGHGWVGCGHGVPMGPPGGWGSQFNKGCSGSCNCGISSLCHRKDNNYACMHMLLDICSNFEKFSSY